MRKKTYAIILCAAVGFIEAQEVKKDTITGIEEVKVTGQARKKVETEIKKSASIDEYLSGEDNVTFVKRGAYAWEAQLNNMSSERSTITVDGMHIFGACTDKMDPITTYLESNNLSSIEISSGQEGGAHGATISGNIDLKRINTAFTPTSQWKGSYQTGYESNNQQFLNLGNLSYSNSKVAVDGSIAFRKAKNYHDGSGNEIMHSQYTKFNTSLGVSYKLGERSALRADAIFDKANDVGYPALPMDLWLSRAIITSLTYTQLFDEGALRSINTKAYFNSIEHYMDDTQRPENLVHMDMPGWSMTAGLTSVGRIKNSNFSSEVSLNAYHNRSIAEMRMYPQDRSERTMFAYSWPWVTTEYVGGAIKNSWQVAEQSKINFGGSLGYHHNQSKYVEFNKIFYPHASPEKSRILPSLHAGYQWTNNTFGIEAGTGFGQRAPSVSEGYGYYIYNSYDRYDYVGNPDLENETSYEANLKFHFNQGKLHLNLNANYFHIQDYIVGKILTIGSPMNYQSVGVKGYTSLEYADLFNVSLHFKYDILDNLYWKGSWTYAKGTDNEKQNLPFIRPLSFETLVAWKYRDWGVQSSFEGDFKHTDFSPSYGESESPAFAIWNLSADYTLRWKNLAATLQVGVQNILNKDYTTYADWGNIPRMGRNIFTTLKFNF